MNEDNIVTISHLEELLNKHPHNGNYDESLKIAIKILKNDIQDITKEQATAAVNSLIRLEDFEKLEKPYIDEAIKHIIFSLL